MLTGIQKFKQEFSGNIELDSDDIELAGSIILNSKFEVKHINMDEPDSDIDNQENDEKSFDVNPEGYFPDDNNSDNDNNESDYGDYDNNEDKNKDEDYEENPYFFFNKKSKYSKKIGSSGDLAKIEHHMLLLGVSNSNELSIAIMKMIQIIKNSNISVKVKQNRINFFATIR